MDEKKLIKLASKGNVDAFETLIRNYEVKVYNVALHMLKNEDDAKDVAQDTLIKIYKKLKDFNGKSSFSTWIYRITVNTSLDHLRKIKREKEFQQKVNEHDDELKQEFLDKPEHSGQPEKELLKKEKVKALYAAMERLKPDQKSVIVLRDIQGLSYKEIAQIIDATEGTVKSRLNRARSKLKDELLEMELFKENSV